MTNSEILLQWAFAISPFPSYLPQYFSMLRQLSNITNDDNLRDHQYRHHYDIIDTHASSSSESLLLDHPQNHNNGGGGGMGGDPLRKRTSVARGAYNTTPGGGGGDGSEGMTTMMIHGTPSKSFEGGGNNNNGDNHDDDEQPDAGLSRATVLLLLSAHLLRLLYFHGVILLMEEEKGVEDGGEDGGGEGIMAAEPILSSDLDVPTMIAPMIMDESDPVMRNARAEVPSLQWDLLGQSISMIIMQLMLLHTMMLLRRKHMSGRGRRGGGGRMSNVGVGGGMSGMARLHSTDSLQLLQSTPVNIDPTPPSPRCGSFLFSLRGMDLRHTGQNNHSPRGNGNANTSSSSSWLLYVRTKWRRLYRATTLHLLHLFSPYAILQTHSFLEYLELLLVSSMTVKLVFDYHWYPRYGVHFVEWLKQTSIILESCLALPQAVRNQRKGTTEGLSMVMVGGWVAGDFFKLCYFTMNLFEGGNSGNVVFIWGCLLSLTLDSIVGIQMARQRPEILDLWKRVLRSLRHGKTAIEKRASENRSRGMITSPYHPSPVSGGLLGPNRVG